MNIIFTFCFRKIFSKGPYNSSAAALAECDILIIIISCNLLKANFFIHFYFDQHHFLIRFFYFDKTKFICLMLNLHLAFIHFLVNFIWFFILKLLLTITNLISVPLIVVFLIFFLFPWVSLLLTHRLRWHTVSILVTFLTVCKSMWFIAETGTLLCSTTSLLLSKYLIIVHDLKVP